MAQQTHGIHGALPNQHDEIDNANRLAFEENFRIVKKCWTEEMLTHDGKFWKVPAGRRRGLSTPPRMGQGRRTASPPPVGVVPKPLQKPHPPLFQPSPARRTRCASAPGGHDADPAAHASILRGQALQRLFEVAGKPKGQGVGVLRDVIIADSDEEAMALCAIPASSPVAPGSSRSASVAACRTRRPASSRPRKRWWRRGYAFVGTVDTVLRSMEPSSAASRSIGCSATPTTPGAALDLM